MSYENFKCEDCGNDKFTLVDDKIGRSDITLHCFTKDCEASYTFSPEMKMRSSCHPTKICPCGCGFLSREDNYCSGCGKKNPHFPSWKKDNMEKLDKQEEPEPYHTGIERQLAHEALEAKKEAKKKQKKPRKKVKKGIKRAKKGLDKLKRARP